MLWHLQQKTPGETTESSGHIAPSSRRSLWSGPAVQGPDSSGDSGRVLQDPRPGLSRLPAGQQRGLRSQRRHRQESRAGRAERGEVPDSLQELLPGPPSSRPSGLR